MSAPTLIESVGAVNKAKNILAQFILATDQATLTAAVVADVLGKVARTRAEALVIEPVPPVLAQAVDDLDGMLLIFRAKFERQGSSC